MARRVAGGMEPEELVDFAVWVERQGGRVVKWLPLISGVCYVIPATASMLRTLRAGVWDEPDVRVYALGHDKTETAPGAETATWNVQAVQAPELWPRTQGAGVGVAVVDTGVDLHHPGLPHVAAGYNVLEPDAPPQDDNGHGTHVAGIVAGEWRTGSGVAPQATIVPVKVLDALGVGSLSDVVEGLYWCLTHRIPIINMSLGAPVGTDTMRAAVKAVADVGLLTVVAAGNEGPRLNTVAYPAYWPETVAVAASTEAGAIAEFSSRGSQVDIAAPGQAVVSTWPGGGTRALSGTSMAAPHVSGGAALLWSLLQNGADAEKNPRQMLPAILDTCARLAGFGPEAQGHGLLQVAAAASRL